MACLGAGAGAVAVGPPGVAAFALGHGVLVGDRDGGEYQQREAGRRGRVADLQPPAGVLPGYLVETQPGGRDGQAGAQRLGHAQQLPGDEPGGLAWRAAPGEQRIGEPALAHLGRYLFGAFAARASGDVLPYSGTASFSLTPNFQHSTINMYAELREPIVWATSTVPDSFSADGLVAFLRRVADDTAAKSADIPAIVEAIKTRLSAAPSESLTTAVEVVAASGTIETEYAHAEPQDDEVQVEDRLWHIILAAIASSAAVILVGPPGTGKSALISKAVRTISVNRQANGQPGIKIPIWATPDESWTSRELIGGETVAGGEIVFQPGWVLRAIAEERWLVLDEANRGDLDRIFGALLTWLAGEKVTVGVESPAEDAKLIELGWTHGQSRVEMVEGVDERRGAIRYLAGKDWRLLGTYNALDTQRVFRIGAALGRRFVRVPIPSIPPSLFNQVLESRANDLPDELRTKISLLYNAHYQEEITRLGPALFLGMCNYLRVALETRATGSSTTEPEGSATMPVNAEQWASTRNQK